ncbi:MAG: ABC transporter permease [Candidatus Krumholzibacteria bacterium]|nr:ABC transporter permease [Candidatus Krumholzibacteria bacterium]
MTIELRNVVLLVRKEVVEARRNRWVLLYATVFAVLSLALSWMGLAGLSGYGLSGFGRTAASMINLVMLTVPLMGLTLGATSLAGERERGTLLFMASQPLTRFEVLAGKFIGMAVALLGALVVGFGLSGVVIAYYGGTTSVGQYVGLLGLTFILAMATLGIGMAVASLTQRTDTAIGVALFTWLVLVVIGDLGIIGGSLLADVGISRMFALVLINPLQVFKLAAILTIRGSLDVLGPVGVYATRAHGGSLLALLVAVSMVWVVAGFCVSYGVFRRKGAV